MTDPRERFRNVRPRGDALTEVEFTAGPPIPAAIAPDRADIRFEGWLKANLGWVREAMLEQGAVLFRGFLDPDVELFQAAVDGFGLAPMPYSDRHTPRHGIGRNVYTSTDYPASQPIELHSEMSYAASWPGTLWFFCLTPPDEGGATPLADNRLVYRSISEPVREQFETAGVSYIRHFGGGVRMDWRDAFQVEDRASLEEIAARDEMTLEWGPGDHLRVTSTRPATRRDEVCRECVWFNQAHAFHPSSLPPEVREAMFDAEGRFLSDDVCFGDSRPIEEAQLADVRRAYQSASVRFEWRAGDLVVVDNVIASHGRDPYTGPRQIAVSMSGERLV